MGMFKNEIIHNYRLNSRVTKASFAVARKETDKWYGFCLYLCWVSLLVLLAFLTAITIWD
jgi:hypothetical protein